MIGLDKYEVEVANMANDDKRYFDISVTTNVKFKVEYSQAIGSWVTTNNRTPDVFWIMELVPVLLKCDSNGT